MTDQVAHLRGIVRRGTSAHRQLELYHTLRRSGRPPKQALRDVTKWLRASTEAGDFIEHTAATPIKTAA
jgi:carboxylate-amine ligase